jgi:hypothetical protein
MPAWHGTQLKKSTGTTLPLPLPLPLLNSVQGSEYTNHQTKLAVDVSDPECEVRELPLQTKQNLACQNTFHLSKSLHL